MLGVTDQKVGGSNPSGRALVRQNLNALEMSGAFGVSSVNPLLSDLLVPADQAIEVIAPGGRWAGPDPKRPGSGHTRTLSSPRKGLFSPRKAHARALFSPRKAVVMGTPATGHPAPERATIRLPGRGICHPNSR